MGATLKLNIGMMSYGLLLNFDLKMTLMVRRLSRHLRNTGSLVATRWIDLYVLMFSPLPESFSSNFPSPELPEGHKHRIRRFCTRTLKVNWDKEYGRVENRTLQEPPVCELEQEIP